MAKNNARTGTAPFAHLLALVTGKGGQAKRAEDEKPEDETDAEEDDEETEAEDDKPDEDAEDGKPDEDAESEDDEEKAEEDDDEDSDAKAYAAGFAAAQARGRKIFGTASAAIRPDMAAHLAFDETMPAKKAIGMLDMAAAGGTPAKAEGSRLGRRMQRVVIPNPGSGSGAKKSEDMSFGEMAKAAGKKAGIF